MCGVSDYSYDFEFYTGQENDVGHRLTEEPDFGASANVVVLLSRTIPRNQNYKLYFDNYYTSIGIMPYLAKQGILPPGTIRQNKIPNNKMPSEMPNNKMPSKMPNNKMPGVPGNSV